MNANIRFLLAALAAQIVIIAMIYFSHSTPDDAKTKSLVNGALAQADFIQIQSDDHTLSLRKKDATWMIEGYGDLSARAQHIESLSQMLEGITLDWPVAQSSGAAERFNVSEKNFQKRVEFQQNGKTLSKFYVGTSPGFRKQHVRTHDSDNIYAVELAQHRISSNAKDWFDNSLLAIKGNIQQVNSKIFSFEKSGTDEWQVTERDENQNSRSEAIATWVNRFKTLQVSELVQGDVVQKILITNPVFQVNFVTSDGPADFSFYEFEAKKYVKKHDDTNIFLAEGFVTDPILNAKRDDFIDSEAPQEEASNDAEPSQETADNSPE